MMSGDSFYCAYLTLSSAHQQLQLWTPTKNTSKHKLPQLPAVSVYLQLSEMVVRAEGRWALVTQAGGVRVLEEELECCTQSWFSTTFYKQLSLMVRLHHSTIDSSFFLRIVLNQGANCLQKRSRRTDLILRMDPIIWLHQSIIAMLLLCWTLKTLEQTLVANNNVLGIDTHTPVL